MSFALPESLRDYIDARDRSGEYGDTSEYLRTSSGATNRTKRPDLKAVLDALIGG